LWFIKKSKKYNISVLPEISKLYAKICDPQFENYQELKKIVEVYHDAQHYNDSRLPLFEDRALENNKYLFDKYRSFTNFCDLLLIKNRRNDTTINDLISENIDVLEQMENSQSCNSHRSLITSLINNHTLINTQSRTILENVFFNFLQNTEPFTFNNNDPLIKSAVKVC
jgi:hypothetical protein